MLIHKHVEMRRSVSVSHFEFVVEDLRVIHTKATFLASQSDNLVDHVLLLLTNVRLAVFLHDDLTFVFKSVDRFGFSAHTLLLKEGTYLLFSLHSSEVVFVYDVMLPADSRIWSFLD